MKPWSEKYASYLRRISPKAVVASLAAALFLMLLARQGGLMASAKQLVYEGRAAQVRSVSRPTDDRDELCRIWIDGVDGEVGFTVEQLGGDQDEVLCTELAPIWEPEPPQLLVNGTTAEGSEYTVETAEDKVSVRIEGRSYPIDLAGAGVEVGNKISAWRRSDWWCAVNIYTTEAQEYERHYPTSSLLLEIAEGRYYDLPEGFTLHWNGNISLPGHAVIESHERSEIGLYDYRSGRSYPTVNIERAMLKFSPSGLRLAYGQRSDSAVYQVWIFDLLSGERTLVIDSAEDVYMGYARWVSEDIFTVAGSENYIYWQFTNFYSYNIPHSRLIRVRDFTLFPDSGTSPVENAVWSPEGGKLYILNRGSDRLERKY